MGRFETAALLAAFALLTAADSRAQAQLEPPLTLERAIALAEENSPDVAAARLRAQASAELADSASRFWIPALTLDSAYDRTDLPSRVFAQKLNRGVFGAGDFAIDRLNDPGFDGQLETTFGLHVPLDVFGSYRAGSRAARAGAEAAAAGADAARGDARLAVTDAYLDVLAGDRAVEAAQKSLEAARALEHDVALRKSAGTALEADLLRVRSRRRQREVGLGRARSDADLARTRLRLLLGWTADRSVRVAELPAPAEEDLPLDAWIARARTGSPDLAAAKARARVPEELSRRERLAAWPSLDLAGSYQDERNSLAGGRGGSTVELRLHWNVWSADRSARLAAARNEARAAEETRRSVEIRLQVEAEAAWRSVQVARLEAEAAHASRREAVEVYRVTHERWQSGKAALVDLLDAESATSAAVAAEARADAGVARARASLRRVAGLL